MPNSKENKGFYHVFYKKPWLVSREFLTKMRMIADSCFSEYKALEKKRDLETFQSYIVSNTNIAIMKITGVIEQKLSFLSWFFGGTSTEAIASDLKMLKEKGIKHLILDIDSPGGDVDGIIELSDLLFKSRKEMKIYAVSNPLAASAAFWIASTAKEIYLASESARVGSVGVYTLHIDISEANKKDGVKITEIASAKNKADTSPYSPLPKEAKEDLQKDVEYIHEIFIDHLARNMKIDREEAEKMGSGKVFTGQMAIDNGFAHKIKSLDSLISELGAKEMPDDNKDNKDKKPEIVPSEAQTETETITASVIKTKYPAIHDEIFQAGIINERERSKSIDNNTIDGFEKLAGQAKTEGWTGDKFLSEQIKKIKDQGLTTAQMQADNAPTDFQGSSGTGDEKEEKQKELQAKVKAGMDRKRR